MRQLTDLLPTAINMEAIGERGGARPQLVTGTLQVVDSPPDDIRDLFDDRCDQDDAREAFDGNVDAALALPMTCTVNGTCDFAKALAIPTGARADVAISAATVTAYLARPVRSR